MSGFKGTPGPWYIDEGWLKGHVSISADSHSAFAQVVAEMEWEGGDFEKDPNNSYYRRWCKENEPLVKNAKLIAAAPELLEALQNYMAAVNQMNAAMNDGVNVQGAISNLVGSEDMARETIKKALGQ